MPEKLPRLIDHLCPVCHRRRDQQIEYTVPLLSLGNYMMVPHSLAQFAQLETASYVHAGVQRQQKYSPCCDIAWRSCCVLARLVASWYSMDGPSGNAVLLCLL